MTKQHQQTSRTPDGPAARQVLRDQAAALLAHLRANLEANAASASQNADPVKSIRGTSAMEHAIVQTQAILDALDDFEPRHQSRAASLLEMMPQRSKRLDESTLVGRNAVSSANEPRAH